MIRPSTAQAAPAHLWHMEQCFDRAGRWNLQVLHFFGDQIASSQGYRRLCRSTFSVVTVPGSDTLASTKQARQTITKPLPMYLQPRKTGAFGNSVFAFVIITSARTPG